eukprot:g5981.t1
MFTKTGLRPQEVRGLETRSGIGKKLPPVADTHHRRDFRTGGGSGVTALSSLRRKKDGGRGTSNISSTGRREVRSHVGGGGCGNRGRSQSAGRRREVSSAARAHCLTRRRPEWDDSLRDTSQYRLTAEEALRRKISLVSKHNTLVFGLGDGNSTSKKATVAAASSPCSVGATAPAATEVAQGRRSLKPQHQQQSREARGGRTSAVSSGSGSGNRTGSGLSTIYRGGGRGSGGRKGKVAVLHSAPATDADLTGAIKEGDGAAYAGGINDATMSLYTKHGGGGGTNVDGHQGCHDGRSGLGSDRNSCGGDVAYEVEPCSPGGGGGTGGREAVGSTSLADLEVGIKAFSQRVGRLETFSKAGLLEEGAAAGNGSGTESESDARERDETNCGSHQSDAVELVHTGAHEGSASDNPLDDSSDHRLSAVSEPGASEVHHESPANPWSVGGPSSSSPVGGRRRRRRAAAAAQASSASDVGGREEVGLVKRIELLQAQVLGMCSASSPAITDTASSTTGSSNQDKESFPRQVGCETDAAVAAPVHDPSPGVEPTAREEQLRGVIVDLLSLSAALLERATSAERRLREVGRGSSTSSTLDVDGIGIGVDSGDVYERARRVRASAGAAAVLAREDGEVAPATATQVGAKTDSPAALGAAAVTAACTAPAGAPSLPEDVVSRPSGGSPRRVNPPPPPRRSSTTARSVTADCWGEALDAIGRLMDSPPSCFGLDVAAYEQSLLPSPPPPKPPQQQAPFIATLPPDALVGNRPMSVAAAATTPTVVIPASPNSSLAETGTLLGQMLPPPPPPKTSGSDGGVMARLEHWWRAASRDGSNVFLIDTAGATVADGGGGGGSGAGDRYAHLSESPWAVRRKLGGPVEREKEEGEEDGRASPASRAPNPSKKPQHPFRGEQRSTPMRSPTGLRRHEAQARGGPMSESKPRRGFPPGSCPKGEDRGHAFKGVRSCVKGGGSGGGGNDWESKAPRPPIGQWYTPPSLIQD